MNRILIIKLGALGDVVRTTPLLRVLKGEITWVTKPNAVPLLRGNPFLKEVIEIEKSFQELAKKEFDMVLSLDEDNLASDLANRLKKKELIGTYKSLSGVQYTDSSREWFDMSLISRLGKARADKKKWENRKSYQEILFGMLQKKFREEEYILPYAPQHSATKRSKLVGIESRAGERWVAKRWGQFPLFLQLLRRNNISYLQFKEAPTLQGFLKQIERTACVVTTDSLALHLALGLKKKIIVLFTCTSPHEIHGYDRTIKVVSPLLKRYFYTTKNTVTSGNAISVQKVFHALQKFLKASV